MNSCCWFIDRRLCESGLDGLKCLVLANRLFGNGLNNSELFAQFKKTVKIILERIHLFLALEIPWSTSLDKKMCLGKISALAGILSLFVPKK